MFFDFADLPGPAAYKLLASTVTPRPIAWVTSQDREGRLNAAPFSFFNVFCADPPILGIGIGRRPAQEGAARKDSWANIHETGEFVVQLVDEANAVAMNWTATPLLSQEDELSEAAIETMASRLVSPPRIASSPVAFECRLFQEIALGENSALILGKVVAMHIRDEAVSDAGRHQVATERLALVGRMHGAGWYARTTDLFQLDRIGLAAWRRGER